MFSFAVPVFNFLRVTDLTPTLPMIVVQRKPVRLRFGNVWVRKYQTFYNEPSKELKELTWRGSQLKHCKGHIRLDVSFARFRRSGSEKQILSVTKFKTIQIIVIHISIKNSTTMPKQLTLICVSTA